MLVRMRREQAVVDEVSSFTSSKTPSLLNSVSNHIDQFIIIDRNTDIVTPLCTQLTYEGLIDETMGINHCKLYLRRRKKKEEIESVYVKERERVYINKGEV